jgi:hypothetical protein
VRQVWKAIVKLEEMAEEKTSDSIEIRDGDVHVDDHRKKLGG